MVAIVVDVAADEICWRKFLPFMEVWKADKVIIISWLDADWSQIRQGKHIRHKPTPTVKISFEILNDHEHPRKKQ